jgi:hypothetical protein
MKNDIFVLCLLPLIFNNSCVQKDYKTVFEKVENVKIILLSDSSTIGIPLDMKVYKEYLFISDFHGDSLIWMYNTNQNKMIKKYAPKGIGPTEFQSPIQILNNDSIFIIHNRGHYTFRKYLFNSDSFEFEDIIERNTISTDIDMICSIGNKYVASGRFNEGRYALLDENGSILDFFDEYPNYNKDEIEIPNFPKFMFHQTRFTYNKKKKLLASITNHVLEILDCSQNIPIRQRQVLLSSYKYTYQVGDGWARAHAAKDNEVGVQHVASTNEYIYMLYNPNTAINHARNKEYLMNEIWIFDWDGNPIYKIIPDMHIICMCVDESKQVVFCIINDPDPTIAFFKLNVIL